MANGIDDFVTSSGGKSAIIGAGTVLGGPVGGAIAGTALGAYQMIKAARQKKDAKGMVSQEDPEQRRLLDEVNMRRQNIDTGAAYSGQMRDVNQLGASTMENVKGLTGGNVGSTVAALGQIQRNTGTNMNKVMSAGQQQQNYFTSLGADLTNRIAQRKLDLNMYDKMSALAESAQNKKAGEANVMAGASQMLPMNGSSASSNTQTHSAFDASAGSTDMGSGSYGQSPSSIPSVGGAEEAATMVA